MSDLVDPDRIEQIVGIQRHTTRHYARAVSAEQTVYILHSHRCKDTCPDLRECLFSLALDNGIDEYDWSDSEDQPVRVTITRDQRLVPVRPGMRLVPPTTEGAAVSRDLDPALVAAKRLREDGPLHYFDCDRFNVYGYGTRQGDCDCTAAADVAAVVAAREATRPAVDASSSAYVSLLEALTPPLDDTGHAPGCGYTDEHQECGCGAMGHRLWRWLGDHDRAVAARARREALTKAADEMEIVIAEGDVAEVAAPVPGEVNRHKVVAKRDALYEEPAAWLREYAARESAADREASDG